MRNPTQEHPPGILSPVPAAALSGAAALWWRGFGPPLPRRAPPMRAEQGIVALAMDGAVLGVAGLRDQTGGFPRRTPLLARLGFRGAPPAADLVLDGIIVARPRQGIGRALVAAALTRAAAGGHPGLRAEVAARNRPARDFYASLGFVEVARGRFGWPWSGQVLVLRRGLEQGLADA